MIQIVGKETGKVYAKGPIQDCFKKLQEKYPSYGKSDHNHKKGKIATQLYPELLIISKLERGEKHAE